MKRNKKLSMLLAMGMTVLTTAVAGAATNPAGSGDGIAIGTGSDAPVKGNVAIGDNANIDYSNGNPPQGGDIAIGADAYINNYMSQVGSIAIGNNAKVENMAGRQEKVVGMGQTGYNHWGFGNLPNNPEKVVTGIAIGENAFSRSGSVMLGNHKYDGKIGDTEVTSNNTKASSGLNVLQTIIGTNSYSKGSFATVMGAYSAITGGYNGESDTESKVGQNFGANIVGSLNTIESETSGSNQSGMASSIMGVANRTANSNGSLIFGAGNTVTNSLDPNFSMSTPSGASSAKEFQDKTIDAIKKSKSGGAVLALGGGNTVDYAIKSQVMGVNNTLKGADGALSTFNLLNGYNNEGTTVNHISVIGSNNSVKNTDNAVVIGDNRNLSSANNSIVLGSADKKTDLQVADAVAIGHNTDVKVAGGVALGAGSVASVDAGVAGYDPSTKAPSTDTSSTWKATDAAVSVGDGTEHTRQITSVAAGTNDTDAVNVAQLKQAVQEAQDGNDHLVASDSGLTLNGNTLSMNVEDTAGNKVTGSVDLSGILGSVKDTRNTVKAGTNVTVNEAANDDGSTTYTVNVEGNGKVEEGNTGLVSGNTVYEETRVKEDGNYIRKDYTAAENITALDKQVGENANNITNLNNSITNLGGRVSDLDNRMNKVGAGAAALAALHPLDFEPDDKFNLAVGFGNYKDANSMAVGAFYRPDEKTMFSVGGSMGNGENMINVGVSLKFGKHSEYSGYSRTQLVEVITDQNQTIANQDAKIQAIDNENKLLKAQMDEVLKQLAALQNK